MSKHDIQSQPETPKKSARIFQYSQAGGFAFMMSTSSTSAWLEEQEYRELPGAYGIVRSFLLCETSTSWYDVVANIVTTL